MRHGAGAAILDAHAIGTVYIGEVPTAILTQAIQRAKAEQAVQILSRHIVTRVELAGAVIEEPIILARRRTVGHIDRLAIRHSIDPIAFIEHAHLPLASEPQLRDCP